MTQLEEKAMLFDFLGKIFWEYDSYSALMLLVEKIESLGYDTVIYKNYMRIVDNDGNTVIYASEETKSKAIYRACVEFVKWLNEQNKKEE